MILHSIKWRLQAWHALMLVVVLAGFGFTAYQLDRVNRFQRLDRGLQQRAEIVRRALRESQGSRPRPPRDEEEQPFPGAPRGPFQPPRGPENRPPPLREEPMPPEAGPQRRLQLNDHDQTWFATNNWNVHYYAFFHRDGRLISKSDSAPEHLPPPARGGTNNLVRQRGVFRELITYTPPGEAIVAGLDATGELAELRRLGWLLLGAGGGVLLLGLAGGWWMATRAIRPIADISATASKISAGDLSQRIPAADAENELGQLAGVLNSTFSRLEAAFIRQQQFTSDAAHELRTPVSVILTQAQSTLSRDRSPAEYRETLEACQRAAQRMRRLTESLLELARVDDGPATMQREAFDLAVTTRECLELIRPLADERQVALTPELAPVECQGDPGRIAQVITNLLSNAVDHTPAGGQVRITTQVEYGMAILMVADHGPGIAPEHLPHIFDRFYRADAARTSAQGRSGLGLAISKAIVTAHGGTIEVASEAGKGATFTVRLPV